jgi:hypothetical protein
MYQLTSPANRIGVNKTSNINATFDVDGNTFITGSLNVSGTIYGAAKSFLIPHPSLQNKQLQYGVTEGPEHSVFIRGRTKTGFISLPSYWCNLVDNDTFTVQLTPIGAFQRLVVVHADCNMVIIKNDDSATNYIDCYYFIQAERKDIPKLQVEV